MNTTLKGALFGAIIMSLTTVASTAAYAGCGISEG